MKRFLTLFIVLCACLCLFGCQKKAEPEVNPEPKDVVGGWEVAENAEITEELLDIFNKAMENYNGEPLSPVALKETQLVSGINYKFEAVLADGSDPTPVTVVIYKDLQGNCSVTDVTGLPNDGAVVGGFSEVEDKTVTDELKEVWDKANAEGELEGYEPVELLATQVVAGTNYKFAAAEVGSTAVDYEVVIYQDLQGNCKVLELNKVSE